MAFLALKTYIFNKKKNIYEFILKLSPVYTMICFRNTYLILYLWGFNETYLKRPFFLSLYDYAIINKHYKISYILFKTNVNTMNTY